MENKPNYTLKPFKRNNIRREKKNELFYHYKTQTSDKKRAYKKVKAQQVMASDGFKQQSYISFEKNNVPVSAQKNPRKNGLMTKETDTYMKLKLNSLQNKQCKVKLNLQMKDVNFFMKNSARTEVNKAYSTLKTITNDQRTQLFSPPASRKDTQIDTRATFSKRSINPYLNDLKSMNVLRINMVSKSKKCIEDDCPFLFFEENRGTAKPGLSCNIDKLFSQYSRDSFGVWEQELQLKLQGCLRKKDKKEYPAN